MIDLHDLTVVVSLKIDSPDRLLNIQIVLKYFSHFFSNWEMIVVEQGDTSALAEINRPEFRHILLSGDKAHYKSRNLNLASSLSNRPFLLMLDADCLLPPTAIQQALERLRLGADFVTPFNGIVVNVSKTLFESDCDVSSLVESFPFFPKSDSAQPNRYSSAGFEPTVGSRDYDATGGALMFAREAFFLCGGFNTNIVSYGFEDMEMNERATKLGFSFSKLDDCNCYHLEHARLTESTYNNFYRSNENEYKRVASMDAVALKAYALRGFHSVELDPRFDLSVTDSTTEHKLSVSLPNRISASDHSILLVIRHLSQRPVVGLVELTKYLEQEFDDYEIIIVELVSRRFKYLENSKNIHYYWLDNTNSIEDAVNLGSRLARGPRVDTYTFDGTLDFRPITEKYLDMVSLARKTTDPATVAGSGV